MPEMMGSRGVLRERDDGTLVLEVVISRTDAALALSVPLGAVMRIAAGDALAVPMVVTPAPAAAPVQTISTDGQESLILGHNSPLRAADMQRMQAIQRLLQMPTFQAWAWERSGLQELPPDAVEHTATWLFSRCGATATMDLLAGEPSVSADAIIAEFRRVHA